MTRYAPDRTAVAWLVALALCAPLSTARPATGQHGHDAGPHALSLDNGKQWATDVPLRQGMTAIRDAVAADHRAIHGNTETAAQYQALAARIDAQVADIVKNCKLAPAADAQFHVILADLVAASEQMKSSDAEKRRQGAVKVVGALGAYPRYFDHPGWRPLE